MLNITGSSSLFSVYIKTIKRGERLYMGCLRVVLPDEIVVEDAGAPVQQLPVHRRLQSPQHLHRSNDDSLHRTSVILKCIEKNYNPWPMQILIQTSILCVFLLLYLFLQTILLSDVVSDSYCLQTCLTFDIHCSLLRPFFIQTFFFEGSLSLLCSALC